MIGGRRVLRAPQTRGRKRLAVERVVRAYGTLRCMNESKQSAKEQKEANELRDNQTVAYGVCPQNQAPCMAPC